MDRTRTVGAPGRALRVVAVTVVALAVGCSSTAAPEGAGGLVGAPPARDAGTAQPDPADVGTVTSSPDPSAPRPSTVEDRADVPAAPEVAVEVGSPEPFADATAAGVDRACPVAVAPGTPGVTADEIAVGAPRLTNTATVARGLEQPEAEFDEYVDAMVRHVNDTGGIACRRVRVVWHDVDMSALAFGPASEQAMCATWTQDDQVFAAFPGGFAVPNDVLYPCLDRAGVAIVDVRGINFRDRGGFDEIPRLIAVNSVRLDRGTTAQVHALVRQGFLTSGSSIGVVHYDEARETRTVDDALVPALGAHGLSLTKRHPVAVPTTAADPDRERDVANAVLRFKLADVDRVLFVRGAGLARTFMEAAERNAYWPRYGLTTVELDVASLEAPAAQLQGARGIGWYPERDLLPRTPESWPARSACLDFFHARGFRTATYLDRVFAVSVCEGVWFTRAAIEAAPRPLAADGVVAGAFALGATYPSPSVDRTRFGPDQRDGAATYRDVAYDGDCGCFTYVGPPRGVE